MAYNLMLQGVVGSTAYGLNHAGSDVDEKGIFIRDISEIIGMFSPAESYVTNNPDVTLHEVGKFMSLAAKSNPTVLELLYATHYTFESCLGDFLISKRDMFPSTKYVRAAYGGYATGQVGKILSHFDNDSEQWPDSKKQKFGRHAVRLLMQGTQLLETGTLKLDVSEDMAFIFGMGELATKDITEFKAQFDRELGKFDNTKSVLQDEPDWGELDAILQQIRWENHAEGTGAR